MNPLRPSLTVYLSIIRSDAGCVAAIEVHQLRWAVYGALAAALTFASLMVGGGDEQ